MTEPTGEGIPVQYRFVADESTAADYARGAVRLAGGGLVVIVVAALVIFAGASLLAAVALKDRLVGWDALLGGAIIGLVVTAAALIGLRYAGYLANRRTFARVWPPGTVLESGFAADGMVLSRNGERRLVSYADVRMFLRTSVSAHVTLRWGASETYPRGLFPDEAVALLRAGRKARRTLPRQPAPALEGETTEFVVPTGWDRTVARVFARTMLTSPDTYVRLPIVLVLCLLLVLIGVGWWILLVPPAVLALVTVRSYLGTRSGTATAQPEGAILSVTTGQEVFAFHRPARTDTFAYADVRKVLVRGEVAVLQIDGFRPRWIMPAALLPDRLAG